MFVLLFVLNFLLVKCSANTYLDTKVDFIISFIRNERKPTILAFELCWGRSTEIKLVKEVGIAGVRVSKSLQPSKLLDQDLLFLVDLECSGTEAVLHQASDKGLFRAPYRWLVLSNSSSEGKSLLEDLPLLADSDVVLAERESDAYQMIEVHKPSIQAPIQIAIRGYYNGSLMDIRSHRSMFRRRRDLMGQPLTMVIVIQDSNNTRRHLEDRLEPQHDYIAKLSWNNVRLGFLMLNATPKYIFGYRWGYFLNGSWSGMLADLLEGRGDIGTNCLVKADRLDVVSYSDNMAPFHVRFIFRQPPLSYVTNIFRLPFATSVWVALVVCTAASTIVVWAAIRWETKINRQKSLHLDGTLGDALLLAMGAFSQQGCTIEPRKASGRIMVVIMFTTLMAMYAAYSANIVVLLQAPSSTIRSLKQLAGSKLTLAANDVDYNHIILRLYGQTDPIRREIYKRVDPDKGKKQYYDLNEGVQRIRQGLFAFHSVVQPVYRRIEDTFLEHEKCDLMEVDFLGEYDGFTPIYKHSPYLELLRVVLKQIQESGIKAAMTWRHQTPKPKCAHKGAMFSSVGLRDLMPVIFLMLYGAGLSFIMLLVEITVFKMVHSKSAEVN